MPGALPARRERGDALVGILGDIVRTGRWEVGRRTVAYQLMGNLKLDLGMLGSGHDDAGGRCPS